MKSEASNQNNISRVINQPPVRFDVTGIAIEELLSAGTPRPFKVSAASAMRPEWKAFRITKRVHFLRAAFSSASSSPTADVSPDITACTGELMAASHKP